MTTSHEESMARVSMMLEASPGLEEAIRQAAENPGVWEDLGVWGDHGAFENLLGQAHVAQAMANGDALEGVVPDGALEAIVKRVGRPPMLILNNEIQLVPLPGFEAGTDSLIKGTEPRVKSVGRVRFVNHAMAWGGTGWVIKADGDSRLVATNRHVAKLVAKRTSDGRGVFLRSPTTGVRYQAAIDFTENLTRPEGSPSPCIVTDIVYLADDVSSDVALVKIEGDDLPAALELADDEATQHERIALIGYPAFDPRNDEHDQARYFHDLYGVKRYAPGMVMQPLGPSQLFTHDCTSLGGNSGSPLIRLADGKVVGLHFSGEYLMENSAVGVTTLHDILAGKPQGPLISVPRITERPADRAHDPEFFAGRQGYDPSFLATGLEAPWPGLSANVEGLLAVPSDNLPENRYEIRYTHFGVKYNKIRRQPLMTAVNIDGDHSIHIKRTHDVWFRDGRIPAELQLTQDDYRDESVDRGHMVRREDPNWADDAEPGDTAKRTQIAQLANDDTFHYINAALQSSTLNQGAHLWRGLEAYLLESTRTEGFKLCVFTGPVFRDEDPEISDGLPVPLEFWKLAVMVNADTGGLHSTAYLLSQGDLIRDLLEKRSRTEAVEGFVLGEYRTFQISVRDLDDALGYDFAHYLDSDPLAKAADGDEGVETGQPAFVPLDVLDQLVL